LLGIGETIYYLQLFLRVLKEIECTLFVLLDFFFVSTHEKILQNELFRINLSLGFLGLHAYYKKMFGNIN